MTNLVGQPLSKSEQTRTGAKIRLEINPTARDPESLEEEAIRRERYQTPLWLTVVAAIAGLAATIGAVIALYVPKTLRRGR